jgi:hypothetical protein
MIQIITKHEILVYGPAEKNKRSSAISIEMPETLCRTLLRENTYKISSGLRHGGNISYPLLKASAFL